MTGDAGRPSREQLRALVGKSLYVPDLLQLFGVRYRNPQTVPVILDALKDAGLSTVPSFATCGLKTLMLVTEASAAPIEDNAEDDDALEAGTLPQHSFKIGDFPTALAGLCSIQSSDPLSAATYQMRTKNYSQIPVVDGRSYLRGVVTWSSITACYERGEVPTLGTAMLKDDLPVVEVHQQLFSHLPEVVEHGYLVVRNNLGEVKGIITASDIAFRFEATARPFFLVGEIEFLLRKCLGARLGADAIRAVQQKNRSGNIADLMFGQYVKLLRRVPGTTRPDDNWKALGWSGVDRAQFVSQLDRVREIRNSIAHFDSQPLPESRIKELQQFSKLLKQLA